MVGFNTTLTENQVLAPEPDVPLLQTGPGGMYGRAYYGRSGRLTASAPLLTLRWGRMMRRSTLLMGPITLLERLIGIDHCPTDMDRAGRRTEQTCLMPDQCPALTSPSIDEFIIRCTPTAEEVHEASAHGRITDRQSFSSNSMLALPVTRVRQLTRMKSIHECDTETTSHTEPDSRMSTRKGLFTDDAGAGRSSRRQQGHGVRTRTSTHQKRNRLARTQQGSLFVDS